MLWISQQISSSFDQCETDPMESTVVATCLHTVMTPGGRKRGEARETTAATARGALLAHA